MKRLAALLAEEISAWPDLTTRSMFGLRAVYRKGVVFAMLPEKRSLEVADSIAYKDGDWKAFEMKDGQVAAALRILQKAYEKATGRRSSGSPG
ncbi:MAG TPA: hypothetical protein VMT15_05990 [Bryobacteraceae bacterium]|nr:hypothetical protein [Bryobacteraceae bacterium]